MIKKTNNRKQDKKEETIGENLFYFVSMLIVSLILILGDIPSYLLYLDSMEGKAKIVEIKRVYADYQVELEYRNNFDGHYYTIWRRINSGLAEKLKEMDSVSIVYPNYFPAKVYFKGIERTRLIGIFSSLFLGALFLLGAVKHAISIKRFFNS